MRGAELCRAGAAGAAVALTLAVTGCGDDDSDGQADKKKEDGGSEAAAPLKLGETATLEGLKDAKVKIQALAVEDPLKVPPSKNGLTQERPRTGRRFVAVHVRMTNVGKKPFDDVPLNGARLVTDVPKASNGTILLTGKCRSKRFATKLRLAAGESKKGCLPFQVKRGAKLESLQMRLDSGYGPDTGKWSIP